MIQVVRKFSIILHIFSNHHRCNMIIWIHTKITTEEAGDSFSQHDYVVDEDSETDDLIGWCCIPDLHLLLYPLLGIYLFYSVVDLNMNAFSSVQQKRRGKRVVLEQYATLGGCSIICSKYKARMWKEESVNKNVTNGTPIFSLCCMKGAMKLPEVPPTPRYLMDLYNDKKKGLLFWEWYVYIIQFSHSPRPMETLIIL